MTRSSGSSRDQIPPEERRLPVTAEQTTPVYREELTPVSFLERAGLVHAERLAAVDGGRCYTYRELRARSR
jgi:hypothetical protein